MNSIISQNNCYKDPRKYRKKKNQGKMAVKVAEIAGRRDKPIEKKIYNGTIQTGMKEMNR